MPREDVFTMRSPEGVALELPICGPGSRILAYAVDYAFILLTGAVVATALLLSLPLLDDLSSWMERLNHQIEENPNDNRAIIALLIPMFIAVALILTFGELLYFTFWEIVSGGRSIGKIVIGLRVVEVDGRPLTFRSSLIRNLLRIADTLPSNYALGLVAIVLSDRNQRLGDHAAGTIVIRSGDVPPARRVEIADSVQPIPLTRMQLERLGTAELELARGALRRSQRTPPQRARAALDEAARILRERLEIADDLTDDSRRFLERVVATADAIDRRR